MLVAGDRKVERFGWTFAPGDKVMQIENDYDKEVYNGDIGYIDDVEPNAGEIVVSFDGRSVTYGFGELDMLVPAYAATIHKEPGIGIFRSDNPSAHSTLRHAAAEPSLHRRHQRQAAGRASRSEARPVAIAVRNASGRRRWSKLSEWLAPKNIGTKK